MIVYHSLSDAAGNADSHRPTCVALGMFDGIHRGHQAVIQAAVGQAKTLGLASCVFTFSALQHRPASKPSSPLLQSHPLREEILREMGVDIMLCPDFDEFRELSPQDFIGQVLAQTLHARYLYCGENYHFGKRAAGSAEDLAHMGSAHGMETNIIPLVDLDGGRVSSSRIRDAVIAGDMPAAARMLGRPFAIDFEVITGRQLGRTLGSPTINQPLPEGFAVPRFGVYATVATVKGNRHAAVTNVGVKPTVGSDSVLAETYIHDFDGNLYGKPVLVEFLEFIRPERKFASVDELKEQIQRDSAAAEEIGRLYTQG